jgi:hypothetical protein
MFVPKKIQSKTILSALVVSSLAAPGYAADTLPVGGLDANSTAKIGTANLLNAGRYGLGLHLHSASQLMSTEDDKDFMRRSGQARAVFSYGATDWLELSIGLGMTREQADFSQYSRMLTPDDQRSDQAVQESAFAGATAAAKIGVIRDGKFKLALAPFVESGAGRTGQLSMTRSESAKGGWLVMTTLGDRGLAEVDMNVGYRYRNPERVDDKMLRNEFIYQGLVRGYLNRTFGLFAGGQGRMISMARDNDLDIDGKRKYRAVESGELTGGVSINMDSLKMDIYGGRSPQSHSIGHGQAVLGANLSMTIGGKRRSSLADQVPPAKPVVQQPAKADDDWMVKPAKLEPMSEKDMDLFHDVDKILTNELEGDAGAHDFRPLPQKAAPSANDPVPAGAQVDKVEEELAKIREAEARIEEEEEKRQAIEEELDRQERRKEFEAQQRAEEDYRKEMRQRIEVIPAVTDEDYGWMGLEQ